MSQKRQISVPVGSCFESGYNALGND